MSSLFEPTLLALAAAVWLMVRVGMVMRPVRATSYRSAAPHVEEGTRRLWPGRLLSVGNGSAASPGAGYRAIAARIAADAHPNAGIILIGPNQMDAFARHHRGAPVYSLPEGQTHPTTLKLQLATITAPHERMYVIYTADARQADPQHVIERWLDVYTFKSSDERVGDMRWAVYEVGFKTPVVAVSRGAKFAGRDGETITLVEHSRWPATARPGNIAHVRMVWESDKTPARRYEIFLQLLDSAGRVVAQRAAEPEGGWRPTTEWKPVNWVIDGNGLQLPADLLPGLYALRISLRDASDPTVRLAVEGSDALDVGEITVTVA